ncbi:fasciclin-like arabinogalactan protein 21 [Corylus avellana]|uniref:fasciclin-like arabinogalactan protein 21 n=1 Tax=Corylus avellana TaxID=13451 RepID=UPI001E21D0F2|nr:fasciclin-like arabinogalactan protein 21 [Corylus avellana]
MATSLRLAGALVVISFLASLCFSSSITIEGLEQSFTPSINSISSPPAASPQQSPQDHSFFSHTALLPAILSHLGYHELATAAPSLSESTTSMAWTGPSTLFAPTDSSLRACDSCSVANILREHLIPGAFTINYLRKLPFGSKIETLSPGRCITVTSERSKNGNDTVASAKVFVDGVEVTRPDLFNNGLVIVHGLQGFMAPLSPFSCDLERMTSLSFPFHHDRAEAHQVHPSIMRLMLRDAMLRLRNNGFSILALAMRVKYADLVGLNNMTVFAVDDLSIFTGSHSYISNVRFHIVPNRFLTLSDLEKLPVESTLPTLERGQSLMVTTAGEGLLAEPIRINYVRIKAPEVMRNLKIVVHSVFLPFPHIHPVASAYDQILGGGGSNGADRLASDRTVNEVCDAVGGKGGCAEVPMPQFKPTVEIEDHHGL